MMFFSFNFNPYIYTNSIHILNNFKKMQQCLTNFIYFYLSLFFLGLLTFIIVIGIYQLIVRLILRKHRYRQQPPLRDNISVY